MPAATTETEVDACEAARLAAVGAVVLDVRGSAEWNAARIPGSINVPGGAGIDGVLRRRTEDAPAVVVVCEAGYRSIDAARRLRSEGLEGVVTLVGGLAAWRSEGLPEERQPAEERYLRQMALPQVGVAGQQRLARGRVLVVGIGGLGSSAVSYLAGAGIGTLGLVDGDRVELSNLHRQPAHAEVEIGAPKVESAARYLAQRYSAVDVVQHAEHLTAVNAGAIVGSGWDIVLDCTDCVPTRIALNAAAIEAAVPIVHGAVDRFEGRVAVLGADSGPCYLCLHPSADRAYARSCADAGVLGMAPGVVGALQAGEALKFLLELDSPLRRGVLVVDLLAMRFDTIPLRRSTFCPVCAG